MSGAALGEAKLTGTDLRDANLENVRQRGTDPDDEPFITLTNNEIVKKGPILNGATIMPDGQKYEDCCEKIDKASEKNGETLDP